MTRSDRARDPYAALDASVSERELQANVLALAMLYGWRVVHFRPALTSKGWRTAVQGDGVGFPDCLMLRGERLLVAELKREGEGPTEEQEAWLAAFEAAGAEVCVWRPSDQRVGRVKRVLA